jgi:hypothetical protein
VSGLPAARLGTAMSAFDELYAVRSGIAEFDSCSGVSTSGSALGSIRLCEPAWWVEVTSFRGMYGAGNARPYGSVIDGGTRSSGAGDGMISSPLAGCAALQHCTSAGAVRLKRRISILIFMFLYFTFLSCIMLADGSGLMFW